LLLTVLVLAVALGGCGVGVGKGKAQIWVTRNRGATVMRTGTAPAGLTALQGLARVASVGTAYGGAFVTAIDGVSSSRLHQRDWFYFVNGYESDRGAASYRLRAGDVEWWDYRAWQRQSRAPVVVGAFPEPFVHGYDGRRRQAAVRYQPGFRSLASRLARIVHARSLAPLGVPVAPAANLLEVRSGPAGLVAELLGSGRAGDPVRFIVSGRKFARSLARDPDIVRYRYQALP
jgi:hypothetical protein